MTLQEPIEHYESIQKFLDVVEDVIREGWYKKMVWLVERDKAELVLRDESKMEIIVKNVALTPVKALRWDYLNHAGAIEEREFILYDKDYSDGVATYAGHYIKLFEDVEEHLSILRVEVYRFKDPRSVKIGDIKESNLEGSELERKLALKMSLPEGEIKVAEDNVGDDEFSKSILEKVS